MSPSIVPAVVVGVAILALAIAVLVALALDRPDPAETALAYEEAWDRLDFDLLWRLSGPSLRDGRSRAEFIADKGERFAGRTDLAGLVVRVEVQDLDVIRTSARATTRLALRDGGEVHNQIGLRRTGNRWAVIAYRLGEPRGRAPSVGRGDAVSG
ncbi:MAG TPA: hypothetical protein VI916_06150 [Acidimicrobiia bacterium]|nr:hypothetical protein [Acidimicrobiia bacterium]